MAQAQAFPATLPVQDRPVLLLPAGSVSIPWTIWFLVVGVTTTLIGGTWDFAWHMSIGRERFWTPPHVLVQSGGLLVGIACTYAILAATLAGASRVRNDSVHVLGVYAPAGALIAFWGSLAMFASAPFDNWWHNAYGLDVQIITPPHGLLSLGYFATQIGAMAWMASIMNRSQRGVQSLLTWLFLIVGSICVALFSVLSMSLTLQRNMHTAACYLGVAFSIPIMMFAAGWGSVHRWGCTIVAAIYTGLGLGSEWLLPLVPAHPRLGPVYHNVTHLIPLQFPLLLIVPAFAADVLLQKLEGRSSWIKAAWIGPAFVLSFLAVQWPFANFLMSPASRNPIFGTAYFFYFDPAGFSYDPYKFRVAEKPMIFVLTIAAALLVSILTTRLGLGLGGWMRRVRR